MKMSKYIPGFSAELGLTVYSHVTPVQAIAQHARVQYGKIIMELDISTLLMKSPQALLHYSSVCTL